MPDNPENYMAYRFKKGTQEHLWYKWYNKLWKAYPKHAQDQRGEPPSFMRDEFMRDVLAVIKKFNEEEEKRIAEFTEIEDNA